MQPSTAKIVQVTPQSNPEPIPSGAGLKIQAEFFPKDQSTFGPGQYKVVVVAKDSKSPSGAPVFIKTVKAIEHGCSCLSNESGSVLINVDQPMAKVLLDFELDTSSLPTGNQQLEFALETFPTHATPQSVGHAKVASMAQIPLQIAKSNVSNLGSHVEQIVRAVEPIRTITSKDVMATRWTDDVLLYAVIKQSCAGLSFNNYQAVLDQTLCTKDNGTYETKLDSLKNNRYLPFTDSEVYRLFMVATEAFVAINSSISPHEAVASRVVNSEALNRILADLNASDAPQQGELADRFAKRYLQAIGASCGNNLSLPYLKMIAAKLGGPGASVDRNPNCADDDFKEIIISNKLCRPIMIELIWSYWHEQGMQVQTMHALRDRFLNRRTSPGTDPLASFAIGGMRRWSQLFYQHTLNEQHRLTIIRRAHEYEHQYGCGLQGSAVPPIQTVDSRSRFLEAFHNLLASCVLFFREDDDTNRRADAFPVLNALKEVHFLLSEGAHNQYGDLPTTSRIEMLMEQWLLSRPEMQKFLPSREAIAYPEPWMGPVDAMKTIQGWTNTSVMYFHDLANFGEQILLSIRFNNWSTIADRTHAANWARVWRSELQGYMHAYRTVTGVDLTNDAKDPQVLAERNLDPSIHLMRRYREQQQAGLAVRGAGRLPGVPTAVLGRSRPASLPAPKNH